MANKIILSGIIGIIVGLFLYDWFLVPEVSTKIEYITEKHTDTVFVEVKDVVTRTKFKYIYERDTIIENYKPKIRGFKEFYPTLYGDVYLNGEVLGELRYISLEHSLNIPVVTNTINNTKTITNTIHSKGLYLGGGINSNFNPIGKIDYLDKDYIFSYQYTVGMDLHQIGISKKMF